MLAFLREFVREILACWRDSTDEHYYEGYRAYNDGKDVTENPFPDGSMASCEWEVGWTAAEDEMEFNA